VTKLGEFSHSGKFVVLSGSVKNCMNMLSKFLGCSFPEKMFYINFDKKIDYIGCILGTFSKASGHPGSGDAFVHAGRSKRQK
jgi:hypothetical protein